MSSLPPPLIACYHPAAPPFQLKYLKYGPGYQVPFSARIKEEVKGAVTGAVGAITEPKQAEEILQQGKADLILLGREFLRNPYWPLRAAQELGVDVAFAPQYQRAKPSPVPSAAAAQKSAYKNSSWAKVHLKVSEPFFPAATLICL